MARPKTLGHLEVRELAEALGERSQLTLVKRLVSGSKWSGDRVEFSMILDEDQVGKLAEFFGENYNVAPFVGL